MRLGSLCSGYGGLDLAVEAHYGAETVWHAETDKDCSKVLAHHWPAVPNHGDLTLVDWSQVEPVDVVCAGFPCQPFSVSGRKRGADDERAIFPCIADGVGFLQPSVVVLENVAAIVGFPHGRGGGLDVVATLTELGFDDIRWGVVRASDPPVFAPHRRARWFCVAHNSGRTPGGLPGEGGRRSREVARPGTVERTLRSGGGAAAHSAGVGRESGAGQLASAGRRVASERAAGNTESRRGDPPFDWRRFAPAIERWERILGRPAPAPTDDGKLSSRFVEMMMGLPENWVCGLGLSRAAELKALGNGVCPQQAALALRLLAEMKPG